MIYPRCSRMKDDRRRRSGPTSRFWDDPFFCGLSRWKYPNIRHLFFYRHFPFPYVPLLFYFSFPNPCTSPQPSVFWSHSEWTMHVLLHQHTYHILHTLYYNLNSSQLYTVSLSSCSVFLFRLEAHCEWEGRVDDISINVKISRDIWRPALTSFGCWTLNIERWGHMLFDVLISFGQEIRTCGLGENVHRHYFRSIDGKVHGAVLLCWAVLQASAGWRVNFSVQLLIFKY